MTKGTIFKVETDRRRATLTFVSMGADLDTKLIHEAADEAYKNNICFQFYKDDANSVIILFSGKREGIKKIEQFYTAK